VKALLQSMSLGSGAVIIAVCSALVSGLWCWVRPGMSAWLVAFLVPFIVSVCLYWAPVWLGANPSEYSSWALLFIAPWFLAGAIPSAVVVFILRRGRGN
jgi:hypothetical protein